MTLSAFMQAARTIALGLTCLTVAACMHEAPGVSLEQSMPSPGSRMMALAPDGIGAQGAHAIAVLPNEPVASVRDRRYANGVRQEVLLKGSPVRGIVNGITLLARTSRQQSLDEQVPLFKPSEAAIRSEIGAQFPHLAMQIAERESSNVYGPYGLALGRAGGDVHCLYMWQWIDENRVPADAGVSGPMSIRIRLCQAGTTFDAMAAELDHLTIGVAAPDAQVAAVEPNAIILAPPEARAPSPHKPKHIIAHEGHRPRVRDNRLAHRDVPVAAPTATDMSPRYMTAATTAMPIAPQASPLVPAASVSTTKLSGDLPAQAYLGPSAAQKTVTPAKYY